MKRTLGAIAALTVTGMASAQSSVTLFGVVDAAVSYQTTSARELATGATVTQSQTALRNSGSSASRLGLRGTEDLGGGMSASFWLEGALNNDDGTGAATGGGLNWQRRSTVSLAGGFGELRLGRDYTPTYWSDTVFDPFGTSGSGANVIYSVSNSSGLANPNSMRSSNAVAYFLPSDLGGFYGQVSYGLNENIDISNAATNSNAGRYAGGRFGYARGPLDVAASYGLSTIVDTISASRRVETANLGASYDLGSVKLFGELSRVVNQSDTGLASVDDKYDGYLLGASVPVGVGLIRASYSSVRFGDGAAGVTGSDPRAQKFALGYVHNLSKRTALYATVARVNNRNDADYTGGLSSAITTGYGSDTPGFGTGTLPKSATGYDFGIRHTF